MMGENQGIEQANPAMQNNKMGVQNTELFSDYGVQNSRKFTGHCRSSPGQQQFLDSGDSDVIGDNEPDEDGAEDGEILDDEDLSDNDGGQRTEGHDQRDAGKRSRGDRFQDSSSHRNKRKREHGSKRRKRQNRGSNNICEENNPPSAWGSAYQAYRGRGSPLFGGPRQQQKRGHLSQGFSSLYDCSPSSEGSDNETLTKDALMGGYIDASIAASEKEGIFSHKVSLGMKRKKKWKKRNEQKRKRQESTNEAAANKKLFTAKAKPDRPVCRFYLESKCSKGNECPFSHDVEVPKRMEVCRYHLSVKGCCRENCPYMHEDYPCKYYHTGNKCFSGDNCKFSHKPLTEATRRALEMRVAAEDIIDAEDMESDNGNRPVESDYGNRPRERFKRPRLQGGPSASIPKLKTIPSLFEIEILSPPAQAQKPFPQTNSRLFGFYSEADESPKPDLVQNNGIGFLNTGLSANQRVLNDGAGLLPIPGRMSNTNFMGGNINSLRASNQQSMNPCQQKINGMPLPFQLPNPGHNQFPHGGGQMVVGHNQLPQGDQMAVGHNQLPQGVAQMPNSFNSQHPQGGASMPPCLNMLGEAARQKGPEPQAGNTGPNNTQTIISDSILNNSLKQNIINNGRNMENLHPDNVKVENMDMKNSLDIATSSEISPKGQEFTSVSLSSIIKREFYTERPDVSKTGEIQQCVRATQEASNRSERSEGNRSQTNSCEEMLSSENGSVDPDKKEIKAELTEPTEIPVHLPKKQRELFMRIQQNQSPRERELDRHMTPQAAGAEADDDDWYSSDEDEKCGVNPRLSDKLKKLNHDSSAESSEKSLPTCESSGSSSSIGPTSLQPSASTFNILQMINAIKSQSTLAGTSTLQTLPTAGNEGTPLHQVSSKLSSSTDSSDLQFKPSVPVLTPSVADIIKKLQGTSDLTLPSMTKPTPSMDPPVINAVTEKPLAYEVHVISFSLPQPYARLPESVNIQDPAVKEDPRIKWHLQYLETHKSSGPLGNRSMGEEVAQKRIDPRLKMEPTDPHFAHADVPHNNNDGNWSVGFDPRIQGSDPRLQGADPRLQGASPRLQGSDPRLQGSDPRLQGSDPRLQGADPRLQGSDPRLQGADPRLQGSDPRLQGSDPRIQGLNPQKPATDPRLARLQNNQQNHGGPMNMLPGGGGPFINTRGGVLGSPANNLMNAMGDSMMNNRPINAPARFGLPEFFRPMMNNGGLNQGFNRMVGDINQMGPGPNVVNRLTEPQNLGNCFPGIQNGQRPQNFGNRFAGMQNFQRARTPWNGVMEPQGRGQSVESLDSLINSSDPRLRNQRKANDVPSVTDPRLKNRSPGLMEQASAKEIGSERFDSNMEGSRFVDQKNFNMRGQNEVLKSGSEGDSGYNAVSQDNRNQGSKVDSTEFSRLPSLPSIFTAQNPGNPEKLATKFDYRNDPRFKRVRKLADPQQEEMDLESAPQKDSVKDGSSNGSHNLTKFSGPVSQDTSSPLGTSQDLALPAPQSMTTSNTEPDLQVKDHFKSIDPTASPFC